MRLALFASFVGGILPAILWLKFWLKEETHREPSRLIVATFLFGMISVLVAGTIETSVTIFFTEFSIITFIIWAFIEEYIKFLSASKGIKSRFCDDPIDPTIYLITSALGFAAAENILFLLEPFSEGDFNRGIMTITFRFVGATLLHIIASGLIGIIMGFTFFKSEHTKKMGVVLGLILATTLHTIFNSFIILGGQHVLWVFGIVWVGLIVTILILEKIKNIKRSKIIV